MSFDQSHMVEMETWTVCESCFFFERRRNVLIHLYNSRHDRNTIHYYVRWNQNEWRMCANTRIFRRCANQLMFLFLFSCCLLVILRLLLSCHYQLGALAKEKFSDRERERECASFQWQKCFGWCCWWIQFTELICPKIRAPREQIRASMFALFRFVSIRRQIEECLFLCVYSISFCCIYSNLATLYYVVYDWMCSCERGAVSVCFYNYFCWLIGAKE